MVPFLAQVAVSVTHLRREPCLHGGGWEQDKNQESQLLLGESVQVLELNKEWARVEAVEQPRFFDGKWGGYQGWVWQGHLTTQSEERLPRCLFQGSWGGIYDSRGRAVASLSMGSCLEVIEKGEESWRVRLPSRKEGRVGASYAIWLEDLARQQEFQKRREVTALAVSFLRQPYLWGGCSFHHPQKKECVTGVDCSGLVHLVYRASGVVLPRDAHDQFLRCHSVPCGQLSPGDLIFLEPLEKPGRIDHVMMYLGESYLIEATMLTQTVRAVQTQVRCGPMEDPGATSWEWEGYRLLSGAVFPLADFS